MSYPFTFETTNWPGHGVANNEYWPFNFAQEISADREIGWKSFLKLAKTATLGNLDKGLGKVGGLYAFTWITPKGRRGFYIGQSKDLLSRLSQHALHAQQLGMNPSDYSVYTLSIPNEKERDQAEGSLIADARKQTDIDITNQRRELEISILGGGWN